MTNPMIQVAVPLSVLDHLEGLVGCRLATLRGIAEGDPVLRSQLEPAIAQYAATAEALATTKKERVKEGSRG